MDVGRMKRLYNQAVVVGCQQGGCKEKCRKHYKKCQPVWDAEQFARFHLDRAFERFPNGQMFLRSDEYDESLSLLVIHLWRMEQSFDPERNDSFYDYARTYLPKRAVDVGPRRVLGRNGNKAHHYLFGELDEATAGAEPGSIESAWEADSSFSRGADGRGLQSDRDRRTLRALRLLGQSQTDVAA